MIYTSQKGWADFGPINNVKDPITVPGTDRFWKQLWEGHRFNARNNGLARRQCWLPYSPPAIKITAGVPSSSEPSVVVPARDRLRGGGQAASPGSFLPTTNHFGAPGLVGRRSHPRGMILRTGAPVPNNSHNHYTSTGWINALITGVKIQDRRSFRRASDPRQPDILDRYRLIR